MGPGSGYQAEAALELPGVTQVIAVDKNPAAVAHCKKTIKKRKLTCFKSDLFSAFKGKLAHIKFDTIIFNPPYLPADKNKSDMALIGGKKGYEIIAKFLKDAPHHVQPDGSILLLFSNLTNRHHVEDLIRQNGFDFKPLASSRMFFEELFVYLLQKPEATRKLEDKGFTDIHYFAEGDRGLVYTAMHNKKKVAIKIKRPDSEAMNRIWNEGKTLGVVNKHGIGPMLVKAYPDAVVYEFVEGEFFKDWIETAPKAKLKPALIDILKQCHELDKLGLMKEEMHRPLKNALVTKKGKVVLIDFERTHQTDKPHNVTQFCQFLLVRKDLLKKKGIKLDQEELVSAAQAYKETPNDLAFKTIVNML
jgi:release factor glutamine methyltransferase